VKLLNLVHKKLKTCKGFMTVMHWRRKQWGTGARAPLDFQLFIVFWSLQSRTNSDVGLSVVAYRVSIYWHIPL